MKINVLIVEDNPITSQDLKEVLQEHEMIVTGIAKNKSEAIELVRKQRPDIMLVDINLKDGDNGIELIKEINQTNSIPVIYLTANSDNDTVQNALKTHPASYLTKPYDDKDLAIAIELAFNNHFETTLTNKEQSAVDFIFLKSGTRFEKVEILDILYLKAEGSYTVFVTKDKEYTLSGNLNNTSEKIGNPYFLRIHRSYVVNINNVTGLDNDYVFVERENLPISRSHREEVNRVLQRIS